MCHLQFQFQFQFSFLVIAPVLTFLYEYSSFTCTQVCKGLITDLDLSNTRDFVTFVVLCNLDVSEFSFCSVFQSIDMSNFSSSFR